MYAKTTEEKKSLYIETTIPSYATANPNTKIIAAARQKLTKLFWERERHRYNLFTSDAVYGESIKGDSDAAQRRVSFLEGIAVLPVTKEITILADIYQQLLRVPDRAKTDCIHLAVCVLSKIDYLLTWNCKHLGIQTWEKVGVYNETRGLWVPILTTPEQLVGLDMEEL